MSRRLRIAIVLALALLVAAGAATILVVKAGSALAAPAQRPVGPPPPGLNAEPIEFPSRNGTTLRGWLVLGTPGRGVVILLHGIRADRRSMSGRARFLSDAGYTVLLFDLQAHGESGGEHLTFGHLEAGDVRAAVDTMRRFFPGEGVAAIGSSLGGAACLLGDEPLDVDALVLEAVYPRVVDAVKNRLRIRFGKTGVWLWPLLTVQLPYRLGLSVDDLRPIDGIRDVRCPVLVVGGTEDRRTLPEETRQIFDAAPEPKVLWLVEGAAHVDLHRYAGEEYRLRVLEFIGRALSEEGHEVLPSHP